VRRITDTAIALAGNDRLPQEILSAIFLNIMDDGENATYDAIGTNPILVWVCRSWRATVADTPALASTSGFDQQGPAPFPLPLSVRPAR